MGAEAPLTAQRGVLHVSPHPDDEVLGSGATLTLLRDAGVRVVNLAAGLGRPDDHDRRVREVAEATKRLGVDLRVCSPPVPLSRGDDLRDAENLLVSLIVAEFETLDVAVVVSPHAGDRHHGHEVVARAVRRAVEEHGAPMTWWSWGLWADLPSPTLYVPYDEPRLNRVEQALFAHAGELTRNDYGRLLRARAVYQAVLGAERVFGFGSPAIRTGPYADLLTETTFVPGIGWRSGRPRVLSTANLAPPPGAVA